jgi:RecB family exonuclease
LPDVVNLDGVKAEPKRRKKNEFGDKTKAHQRYYTNDGEMVPGVTTILNVINKPYLVAWANRLGLEGTNTAKYKDEAAAIGTLAHYLVECRLKGTKPDLKDFTPAQVERAGHSLRSYDAWLSEQTSFKPIHVELRLVSEKYHYGGTIDTYAELNGKRALIDYKTSASVYDEHKAQVAAYGKLLIEHGYPLQKILLIKLGRSEGDSFLPVNLSGPELKVFWDLFMAARELYLVQKRVKKL